MWNGIMAGAEKSEAELRVAVVGCGYWGKNLVRNFSGLGALGAVCDSNPEQAEALGEQFNAPVREWDDLLCDETIAGVVIATPAAKHAAMVYQALKAGKNVFVEKPVALNLEDAEELVKVAKERERVLMVGHLLQYHPAFLKLLELVRKGEIGRLQYVYSTRLNFGKIRREEDILWSFAPHDISMILALIGDEPNSVTAVGANFLHDSISDITMTHFEFPGGQRGHIFVSWLHPFKEQRLVVIGDRGMLVFDDSLPWDTKLMRYNHEIHWIDQMPLPVKAEGQPVELEAAEPLRNECAHFLECIETGGTPRTDGPPTLTPLLTLPVRKISRSWTMPRNPLVQSTRDERWGRWRTPPPQVSSRPSLWAVMATAALLLPTTTSWQT